MHRTVAALTKRSAATASVASILRSSTAVRAGAALSSASPMGASLGALRGISNINDDPVPKKVVHHPYLTQNKKYLPGFSFPAPRKLEQIVKYALLEREQPPRIKEIWNEYHDGRLDCVATTWSQAEFEGIAERKRRCPRFIYPVLKGDGKFFTLVAEWQDKYCIFTFLDDYRRNPTLAEPYMSVALFDDFLARKQLVLVRGDFSGHLTKRDAAHIMNLMRHFYFAEPKAVEDFNLRPQEFSFDRLLRECPQPPPIRSTQEGKLDREQKA